jgi:hypothetical protein
VRNRVMVTVGQKLFEFVSLADWASHAQMLYLRAGANMHNSIAIDVSGRVCMAGCDFQTARDDGTYPVVVYAVSHLMEAASE